MTTLTAHRGVVKMDHPIWTLVTRLGKLPRTSNLDNTNHEFFYARINGGKIRSRLSMQVLKRWGFLARFASRPTIHQRIIF